MFQQLLNLLLIWLSGIHHERHTALSLQHWLSNIHSCVMLMALWYELHFFVVHINGDHSVFSHLCASVHQAVQVGTGQRVVMLCGWGVKADMVCVWVAGKTV